MTTSSNDTKSLPTTSPEPWHENSTSAHDALVKEVALGILVVRQNIAERDKAGRTVHLIENNIYSLSTPDLALKRVVLDALAAPSDRTSSKDAEIIAKLASLSLDQLRALSNDLKQLQQVTGLAAGSQAISALLSHNLTSLATASVPQDAFVTAHGEEMGAGVAQQTHARATSMITHGNALTMDMLSFIRGTGLAAIDGDVSQADRLSIVQEQFTGSGRPNMQSLFGTIDQALINESMSVYSPAAYLVDLLEFLRCNNLKATDIAVKQSS